jgi:hypothetical protein
MGYANHGLRFLLELATLGSLAHWRIDWGLWA